MEDQTARTLSMNIAATSSNLSTPATHVCSGDVRRARRETKALNVIRNIGRPVELLPVLPVPYVPPVPDATFTLWGRPSLTKSVVYFMYSAGRIKIGVSNGLSGRHSVLKKSGPFPPVILLVIPGSVKEEKKLHARFEADRLHGEWFTLSEKMRRFFRVRLCAVGRASLKKAESDFATYCREILL